MNSYDENIDDKLCQERASKHDSGRKSLEERMEAITRRREAAKMPCNTCNGWGEVPNGLSGLSVKCATCNGRGNVDHG